MKTNLSGEKSPVTGAVPKYATASEEFVIQRLIKTVVSATVEQRLMEPNALIYEIAIVLMNMATSIRWVAFLILFSFW